MFDSAEDWEFRSANQRRDRHWQRGTFPKVEGTDGMFENAQRFNGDVSKWTFPKNKDMTFMFKGAEHM